MTPMTQPQQPQPHDPGEPRLRRGLGAGLRRHRLLLLAIFCIVASLIFLAAPLLKRSYAVAADLNVALPNPGPVTALPHVIDDTLHDLQPDATAAGITITAAPSSSPRSVQFAATGPSHDTAVLAIQQLAARFADAVRHRNQETIDAYAADLQKRATQLDADQATANKAMDQFRIAHRGELPDETDNPTSIARQYDKISSQLDDQQSRQRMLQEQIARLEQYKAGNKPLPATSQPVTTLTPTTPAPQANVADDPEVASLTAQLQLLASQIDEQLTKFNRTEQHPYVVDLRHQQAALQKKLDAAKARAAAGQPAPPQPHIAGAPSLPPANPQAAAAQAADIQLTQLHAELDVVNADLRTLTAQRDSLQAQVDQLGPVRRDYEALLQKQEELKKARAALAADQSAFQNAFPANAPAVADVSALHLEPASSTPVWPRLPAIYAVGLAAGIIVALLIALLAAKTDRSLHSRHEAALLNTPILGAVSEIRSPASRQLHIFWRTLARPLLAGLFILLLVASALLCHRHLTDPGFNQTTSPANLQKFLSHHAPSAQKARFA
ncbi:MAG TPA: hypothetical protein VHQ47_17195 [Phycisphaerae bacterium]|nr:hypothetical protein [Phycisphaerae bacterium]